MAAPRLIVGLGNPGTQYQSNRHNIGFMAVDAIHRKHPFAPWSKKFKGLVSEGEIGGEKVLLIKPQTFMNRSGQSVAALCQFYKISADDMLVVHDELDLQPGIAKLKKGGGLGGHNGLKDIAAELGTHDFWRLRAGG